MRDPRKKLAAVTEEIARLRAELDVVRHQLAFHADEADDARIRMLVSETPLADREYKEAAGDRRRLERVKADLEAQIARRTAEQDALLARLPRAE